MGRARECSSETSRGSRSRGRGEGAAALVELGRRFARFRKDHRRGTRLPDDLKAATLAALRQMPAADVYRTCGVSFRQVMSWKAAKERAASQPDVRVFTVVDEEPAPPANPTVSATASELTLRVGPWSVSVRLVGDGAMRGGGACCR